MPSFNMASGSHMTFRFSDDTTRAYRSGRILCAKPTGKSGCLTSRRRRRPGLADAAWRCSLNTVLPPRIICQSHSEYLLTRRLHPYDAWCTIRGVCCWWVRTTAGQSGEKMMDIVVVWPWEIYKLASRTTSGPRPRNDNSLAAFRRR